MALSCSLSLGEYGDEGIVFHGVVAVAAFGGRLWDDLLQPLGDEAVLLAARQVLFREFLGTKFGSVTL